MAQDIERKSGVEEPSRDVPGQFDVMQRGGSFSGWERDYVGLSRGDGTFLDVSGVSGADSPTDGRASVPVDLDDDGDLDLFVTARNSRFRRWNQRDQLLYHNLVGQDGGGFVRIALEGTKSGRDAFGAEVRITMPDATLTRLKSGGSGFMSQADPRLLFGLGAATRTGAIEITWPSGLRQKLPGVAAGTSLRVVEGEAPVVVTERPFRLPLPPAPGDEAWSAVRTPRGAPLPSLRVRTMDGKEQTLADALPKGGPALVSVWATWCGSCKAAMPELQRLHDIAARTGIAVVGLSLDGEARDQVKAALLERGVTYPTLLADPAALAPLVGDGEVQIPLMLLIDAEAKVKDVFTGWSSVTRERLARAVGAPPAP